MIALPLSARRLFEYFPALDRSLAEAPGKRPLKHDLSSSTLSPRPKT